MKIHQSILVVLVCVAADGIVFRSVVDAANRLSNEYGCQVRDQGKRVHETTSPTSFDCKDTSCRNTCRGGQCAAYVKCRCTRNNRSIPRTSCWRRGQSVVTSEGKCNRNIAANTAIATFNSNGNYNGHAAVFISCQNDYTIRVYDQWCSRSVGYTNYARGGTYYSNFYTITSTNTGSCSDTALLSCRVENAGSTDCPASVSGCRRKRSAKFWESLGKMEEEEKNEE